MISSEPTANIRSPWRGLMLRIPANDRRVCHDCRGQEWFEGALVFCTRLRPFASFRVEVLRPRGKNPQELPTVYSLLFLKFYPAASDLRQLCFLERRCRIGETQ